MRRETWCHVQHQRSSFAHFVKHVLNDFFFSGVQIIIFLDISRYILLCMANQQQQITKQTLPAHPFGRDIFSRKSKGLEADLGCSGEPF